MVTGKYYKLKQRIRYYEFKYGEKYLCVDGAQLILETAGTDGWASSRYSRGSCYLYINESNFVLATVIHLGGE